MSSIFPAASEVSALLKLRNFSPSFSDDNLPNASGSGLAGVTGDVRCSLTQKQTNIGVGGAQTWHERPLAPSRVPSSFICSSHNNYSLESGASNRDRISSVWVW
uniref:Uncharacterized protein n=1 Tax=Knipowitschia caucasica TaxID=637954 RepID=A0AAV2M9Q0_KNICA